MTSYTNNWGLPKPDASDLIAGSNDNLRRDLGALADKTDQQLTLAQAEAVKEVLDEVAPRLDDVEEITDADPYRTRVLLDTTQDLDEMTSPSWNGRWGVSRSHTGPGLPAYPGTTGNLTVINRNNDHYQRIDFRDNHSSWERKGQVGVWLPWQRIDAPYTFQEVLGSGTALSSLTGRRSQGTYRLLESRSYPDLPPMVSGWGAAVLLNFQDGNSGGFQLVAHNNLSGAGEAAYWRVRLGATNEFSDWAALGSSGGGAGGGSTQLLRSTPPTTYWEVSKSFDFTSYSDGEYYMDWLALQHPERLEILDLGTSYQGKPIRAFQLGDPTLPTLYIMCAQHGDEVMGRETAYLWVRDLLTRYVPTLWDDLCIVVTPTVNADRITETRVTSTGTNLNTTWETRGTGEIQAAASVLSTHDVVCVIDAHEGGSFTSMQGCAPTAPEVHTAVRDQSLALEAALESAFDENNKPWSLFPGGDGLRNARNNIAATEGVVTYLFEAPSLLSDLKWSPDPSWRHELYMLAYDTVLDHVRQNLDDYVAAKAAANA